MITQSFCNSAKLDFLRGVHQPGDDYRMALYLDALASLGPDTERYTTEGEVEGEGYEAGGQSLTGVAFELLAPDAFMDFDDPVWEESSITADGALIYNATRGDRALGVFKFTNGSVQSSHGPFRVPIPAPGETAVLRIR